MIFSNNADIRATLEAFSRSQAIIEFKNGWHHHHRQPEFLKRAWL
jgi:hypothetical protein